MSGWPASMLERLCGLVGFSSFPFRGEGDTIALRVTVTAAGATHRHNRFATTGGGAIFGRHKR